MRALIFSAAVALTASPAIAQCIPREVFVRNVTESFGETALVSGQDRRGVVEFWMNPEKGTWTLSGTLPNGVTCILSSGGQARFGKMVLGEGS